MNPIRCLTRDLTRVPAALAAAVLLSGAALAQTPLPAPDGRPPADGPAARPPAPDARPPAGGPRPRNEFGRGGAEATLSGQVARWLVNPNGEVDGLLLADGTQVGVPPHLSAQLLEAVKLQDPVEVTGRRSEAARVVRASAIKNTRTGRSVAVEPPAPDAARPPPRPTGALTAMNASGRIDALLRTGRGDVNGALLQDGTVVRFPPHAVAQLGDTLKPGAVVYARGYGTRSPQGDALEATAIGTNAETARELFQGAGRDGAPPLAPRPPPRDGAAPRPPAGDRPAPQAPMPRAPA